jgi:hypothetical protein
MSIDEEDAWVYEAIRDAQEHLGVCPADLAEPAHQIEPDDLNAFVSQALGNVEFVSPDDSFALGIFELRPTFGFYTPSEPSRASEPVLQSRPESVLTRRFISHRPLSRTTATT